MVQIPVKLRIAGNGYSIYVPKALIECKAIDPMKKYIAIIKEVNADLVLSSQDDFGLKTELLHTHHPYMLV